MSACADASLKVSEVETEKVGICRNIGGLNFGKTMRAL